MKRGQWQWLTAVLWILWQAGALAASPFMACCTFGHEPTRAGEHHAGHSMPADELCPLHAMMAPAPVDHSSHGDHHAPSTTPDGPRIHCQCRVSTAALSAVLLGPAILPIAVDLPIDPLAVSVAPFEATARDYIPSADTPPPRS